MVLIEKLLLIKKYDFSIIRINTTGCISKIHLKRSRFLSVRQYFNISYLNIKYLGSEVGIFHDNHFLYKKQKKQRFNKQKFIIFAVY